MIETKKKQIGEYEYCVEQLGAREGLSVMVKLGKMLGEPLGQAVTKAEAGGSGLDAAGAAVSGLLQNLDEPGILGLLDVFAKKTTVTGGHLTGMKLEAIADQFFAGRYQDLGLWFAFCLEVNYGGFFAVLSSLNPKVASVASALQDSQADEKAGNG